MKNLFLRKAILLVLILALFPLTLSDCKKTDPAIKPVLSTSSVINIAATTATAGGFVTSDGGAEVTVRGICWGTNPDPAISDSKTSDGTGKGQFVSSLTSLTAGTTYHVRAYATNSVGTSYGADVSFTTLGQSPSGLTQPASNISLTGVTLNGIINANNLSTTVTFEYGLTTTYGQTVTATQSPVTGNNLTIISVDISGLTQGTLYHFRVKTVNSIGTINGNDLTFTTLGQTPAGITQPATNISTTGATFNGAVNPNSVSTTVTFDYGTTTSYGQTATATQSPVTGSSIANVSKDITGLNPGTTYHFRVKTVNSLGTVNGGDMLFVTFGQLPSSITLPASNISNTIATLNGVVNANFLSTTVTFEYGLTTSYGQTITASQSPVIGNNITNVTADISGLVLGTTYHFRIKTVNSIGTTYGTDLSFTTTSSTATTVTDIDGNVYNTVTIGTQVWMKENLKTTKLNDGSTIPNISDYATFVTLNTPAFCWYDNNISNRDTYGSLYNWYSVTTMKLCPTGWHVPSDSEWKTLEMYLGMTQVQSDAEGWRGIDQGTQLKSTTGWNSGGNGSNTSGFTALPGGGRYAASAGSIGNLGYWRSSTNRIYRVLDISHNQVNRYWDGEEGGESVRCLKDN